MDFLNKQIKKIDGGMSKMKGGAEGDVKIVKVTETAEGYTAVIIEGEGEGDGANGAKNPDGEEATTEENKNPTVDTEKGKDANVKPADDTEGEKPSDDTEGEKPSDDTEGEKPSEGGARKKKARKSAKKGAKKSAKRKSARRKSVKKGRK